MPVRRRKQLAQHALGLTKKPPRCPFQPGNVRCNKKGGVCSIRLYRKFPDADSADRIGEEAGPPVITCPQRFSQGDLIPKWLAKVVGFQDVFLAREVPFMRSPTTGRAAGRIDLVLSGDGSASKWFGLEIQAVYFSGTGMRADFELLRNDDGPLPPGPLAIRRPDWRSSSAKRLMPQLEIKAPTLGRWGTKLAVAVDLPFFKAIGGASAKPSHDLGDGDILWLVPQISNGYQLVSAHWEVLTLEASSEKLLAAETIKQGEFEKALRARLRPLSGVRS